MKAPIRLLSFVMALSFATAMMPQASGQSQFATSALSPATQERNSFNKGKGGVPVWWSSVGLFATTLGR
jgi:hypothetical protein